MDLLKNAPEAVPRWDNRPEDGPSSITGIFLYFAVVIALFDLAYTSVIALFDLAYTSVSATYTALFPDAFEDLEERTEVSIYRQVAAMVGTALGLAIMPVIVALRFYPLGKEQVLALRQTLDVRHREKAEQLTIIGGQKQ